MATFVILSGCALGDSGGGQQPAQISFELVALGHRVYHCQPNDSAMYVHSEVVEIPCPRHLQADFWSQKAQGATDYWKAILSAIPGGLKCLVVCSPIPWYVRCAEVALDLGWQVVYWRLDDWERMYKDDGSEFYNRNDEESLIGGASVLLATAPALAPVGYSCPIIPNGYNSKLFPLRQRRAAPDMKRLSLIYWGYLRGSWFDWDTVIKVALAKPLWTFHVIGALPDRRPALANAMFHGETPTKYLSRMSLLGDVALIPFISSPFIDAVDPIKAYEYLACGLPIVSCPMPQLNGWPLVKQIPPIAHLWIEAIEDLARTELDHEDQANHLSGRTWRDRAIAFLEATGHERPMATPLVEAVC